MPIKFDLDDVPESYYRALFVARVHELISHDVHPDQAILLASMEIDLRIETGLSSPLRAILANVTTDTNDPANPTLCIWENGSIVDRVSLNG